MIRTLRPLVLLLALAAPAAADPVDDLSRLVRESSAAPDAIMSLLRGLATMPDFDLGPDDVRRAIDAANVAPGGVMEKLLGPTRRLVKRGHAVELHRSEETKVPVGKGVLALGKKCKVRMRVSGPDEALIDEIDGIKVGKAMGGSLYGLGKLHFLREDGKPVVKITAGPWPFTQTTTVDLTPKPKPPAETPGLVGAVPGQ